MSLSGSRKSETLGRPEVTVILHPGPQVVLHPEHPLPRRGEGFQYGRSIYRVTAVTHAMDLPDWPQIIVSAEERRPNE